MRKTILRYGFYVVHIICCGVVVAAVLYAPDAAVDNCSCLSLDYSLLLLLLVFTVAAFSAFFIRWVSYPPLP